MKHLMFIETLNRAFLAVLCLLSHFFVLSAQSFDTTPPIIGHQPVKLGRQGKPLAIAAHIADPSGVKAVTLKISYEGESFEGAMPAINENEEVPVIIKCLNEQEPVFAGPGSGFKKLGALAKDDSVEVNLVRDTFFRIRSDKGLVGYVAAASVEIITRGKLYAVNIPATITQSAFISYYIVALDAFGNEAKTAKCEVRLVDDKQLAKLQAQFGLTPRADRQEPAAKPTVEPSKRSRPFYAKPVFWLATLAAGGGAYYYYTNYYLEDKKDKDTPVDIQLEW